MPTRRPDLVTRIIDNETVILDQAAGKVHQLNAAASCVWSNCDGTRSQADIAARLAATFEISEERALLDAQKALGELQQLGLLLRGQVEAKQADTVGGQDEKR